MQKAKHHSVRIFVFFIFFLLVLPIVLSEKIIDVQTGNGKDIVIVFPKYAYKFAGISQNMSFDILDINLTKLTNETTICSFDIIDQKGIGVLSTYLTYDNSLNHWYSELPILNEGKYNYYVYCNDSSSAGFVSDQLIFTETGIDNTSTNVWLPFIIGLSFFSIFSLIISFNIKEKLLEGLKSFTFILGLVDGFLLFLVIYLSIINPLNVTISEPLGLGFLITHGLALIAIIWMYALFLIERRMRNMQDD